MEKLKIAVQKSGRLSDDSMELLNKCGVEYGRIKGQLVQRSSNYPVEILFLRDDDIPGYVESGVADVGIVGQNVLLEKESDVNVSHMLGFSKCRLSIAIPKGDDYQNGAFLEGKKIATSYPKLTQKWLKDSGIKADVHEISGSVEIAPSIGLAEAICDLVSSGSTLLTNGLKETDVVLKSEAVLVSNNNLSEAKQELLNQLVFRIKSVQRSKENKYILLNAPNESVDKIVDMLPGMRSPTVIPLAKGGWSTIHSVIPAKEFWDKIEALKANGAEGILIIPIEKMII